MGDRKNDVFATSRSSTGECGLGQFVLQQGSQNFKSHRITTMDPRYDCPKHTLPLTASVMQQSLEARNFCKGPLLPGIRKTVIHHPPLVTIIVAPCTHLSQFCSSAARSASCALVRAFGTRFCRRLLWCISFSIALACTWHSRLHFQMDSQQSLARVASIPRRTTSVFSGDIWAVAS